MTLKEQVIKLVTDMPDENFTIEDLHYRLYVLQKVRRGMEEIERGEVYTEEEARKRLSKWLVG